VVKNCAVPPGPLEAIVVFSPQAEKILVDNVADVHGKESLK
jgi:hypothetical protein